MLLVDEQRLSRASTAEALDRRTHLEVEQAADERTARSVLRNGGADVIVVAAAPDSAKHLQQLTVFHEVSPDTPVLVRSGEDSAASLMRALEGGARGYVLARAGLDELEHAIEAVLEGKLAIPRRLMDDLIRLLPARQAEEDAALLHLFELTRKEREVLALLAAGLGTRALADDLAISPATARTHVQRVLAKLDVHSRLEAVAFVQRHPSVGALLESMTRR